jgi:tetratricopeptide (TPR) repeat protein
MEHAINKNKLTEEEGKEAVRLSYDYFKKKDYINTLKILDPILNEDRIIDSKIFTTSLLWSVAGDSLYHLNEIGPAIDAYRKSIEQDEYSSAIPAYAYVVAKHRIINEASNAYRKLIAYEKNQSGNPKRWRLLAFLFGLLYMRETWWFLYIKTPFTKRKLRHMVNTNSTSNL